MTVKIGFIGTGGIAKHHLDNLANMTSADVVAFCDLQLERAEEAAKQWNNAKAYSDLNDMFDAQVLDAVYICLPPMAHGAVEETVVERGIPFLVEKPLGINREVPDSILAKIKEKNLITSVGYQWRYSQATQQAKEWLKDNTFGMALGYWLGGMPKVPWWRKQDGSGGQFVEQTTHITDLLRYLCGDITEVYAAYDQRVMKDKVEGTTVSDVGTVTMKLANGGVATISNTCLLSRGHKVGLDLYTRNGVIEIKLQGSKLIQNGNIIERANEVSPGLLEDQAFIQSVQTGDASSILSSYADAVKTHHVTMAANESALTGKPIHLRGES
jgi:predicted dehydrogenase